MRVAINVEQLLYRSPGGVGRYTAQLAGLLPSVVPGTEVVPFTARHPRRKVDAALAGAGIAAAPAVLSLPRPLLYEAWHSLAVAGPERLARRVAAADVIHAPSLAVPPRGRRPLVVTVHDAAPELFPEAFPKRGLRFHRLGLAAAARRADLVLTVSYAAADELVSHTPIPAARIRVVPNGVDAPAISASEVRTALEANGLADREYVLWVGSLEPRKNVGTLVAAMARLHRQRRSAARLVLAGYSGWLHAGLVAEADRSALGDALVQVGRVEEEELWALYAGATVVAVPSRHEGFGYPAVEAMSQGRPVVAADIPALREVTGGAAVMVEPDDVAGWCDALEGLLDDEAARQRAGDAGRIRAAAFTVPRALSGVAGVYAELLGGPPAAAAPG